MTRARTLRLASYERAREVRERTTVRVETHAEIMAREEAEFRATQLRRMASAPRDPGTSSSSVAQHGGYAGERGRAEAAETIAQIREVDRG